MSIDVRQLNVGDVIFVKWSSDTDPMGPFKVEYIGKQGGKFGEIGWHLVVVRGTSGPYTGLLYDLKVVHPESWVNWGLVDGEVCDIQLLPASEPVR